MRTRQLLLAVLGAAEHRGTRRAVLGELVAALRARGAFAGAAEELTPVRGDPLAALPVLVATAATLVSPSLWHLFHAGAVGPYALTPEAWDAILSDARRLRLLSAQ